MKFSKNLLKYKLYHLSHIDLDGYSCQLITKEIFPNGIFFNSNYGEEIEYRLNEIIDEIKSSDDKNIFILITDLNLNSEEAKLCNNLKSKLKNYNIEIQLLDHHKTGEKEAELYSWYHLDITKSATLITFNYFKDFLKNYQEFEEYIYSVNAVDIWLEDDTKRFEFGKVCSRLVGETREITRYTFQKEASEYKLSLLKQDIKFANIENGYIKLDDNIHQMRKNYLNLNRDNDTLDNIKSDYLLNLLNENKDWLTIYYEDSKVLLTYTLGTISVIANSFLKENRDYDFFMDVKSNGIVSFRSADKIDVGLVAKKLAGGGGHSNASGGKIHNFINSFDYEEIKLFIQNKIDNL